MRNIKLNPKKVDFPNIKKIKSAKTTTTPAPKNTIPVIKKSDFQMETKDMVKTKTPVPSKLIKGPKKSNLTPVPSKLTKGPKQKLDTKKPTLTPAQMKKAKEALKGVGSSYANEIKPFQPKKK